MTEWLLQQREGKGRDRAFVSAAERLMEQDASAALAWARSVGPNVAVDPVLLFMATNVAPSDPRAALELAPLLSTEEDRRRIYFRTLLGWQNTDPDAATSWIESNDVPETVRNALDKRKAERQAGRQGTGAADQEASRS